MKKRWIVLSGSVVAVALLFGSSPQPASARKEYKEAFGTMYANSALAKAGAKIDCTVCHVGESKKNRNAYGLALSKLLSKEKNADKISAALKQVEDVKSDPRNPKSPTFGDNIKAGKLPAGG